MPRGYAGLGPSRVCTRIHPTRRLSQWVLLRKILRFRVRYQLSQPCCLSFLPAMSSRVYLFFPPCGQNLRSTSATISTHTSASNAVAFQSPVIPNARMSFCTQSVYSFSSPPVLSTPYPQGFRKRFALAAARRSFG